MTVRSGNTRAATGEAPTVFIVDSDAGARAAIAAAAASVSLRAEAFAGAEAALGGIRGDRPGCIVLDLNLRTDDAFALIEAWREAGVVLPVIVVTSGTNVATAVQALRAGVFDFFEKPIATQALLERLQAAVAEDAAKRAGWRRLLEFSGRVARLTPREREVMQLVVAGGSSRTIASALSLSPKTVETHRAKMMAKTGVTSLAELIRLGLLTGIDSDALAADPAAAYATPPQGGARR
jgi:FixJ family two-component response regulator